MKDTSNLGQLWAQRTTAAIEQYKAGVMRVQVAPNALAAKAQDSYVAGVQAAVASGKFQRANMAVDLNTWQQAAAVKGYSRIAGGVTAAVSKVQAFWNKFGPVLAANTARVRAMPKASLQDRIQRAVTMMQLNSQFSNS